MKVLFVGNESKDQGWTPEQFAGAALHALNLGFDTLAYKVCDGPNLWYDVATLRAVESAVGRFVRPIAYQYCYGNTAGSSVISEAKNAILIAGAVSDFMLDMEDGFDDKLADMQAFLVAGGAALTQKKVWLTTWGNPQDHNWISLLKTAAPVLKGIMPQVYTTYLLGVWQTQYTGISTPLYPVFTPESYPARTKMQDLGFWEYQDAITIGVPTMPTLNSRRMVADYQQTSQFEAGETESACGYFAVALNKYAGKPNAGPSGSVEQVDSWADSEYKAVYGTYDASQAGGMNVPELHTVLHDAGLHYYDLTAISGTSAQQSDMLQIKGALAAGYPVIAFITESSVVDLTGDIPQGSPYGWNTAGIGHIITWVGVAEDGNLLCIDPANIAGQLQGANTVRTWPRKYDISSIDNQAATVVQLPWLAAIPSGDVTAWPKGFSAQGGNVTPTPTPTPANDPQANFMTLVSAVWASVVPGLDGTTGIYHAWKTDWWSGRFHGIPLTKEIKTKDKDGTDIIFQAFSKDACIWKNGKAEWL